MENNRYVGLMIVLCCILCFGCDRTSESSDAIQDSKNGNIVNDNDSGHPSGWSSEVNSLKNRIISVETDKDGDYVRVKIVMEVMNVGGKKIYIPILPPEGSPGTPGTSAKIMIQNKWVAPSVVYPESLPMVLEIDPNESANLKYSVGIRTERMPKSFDLVGIIVSHGKSSSDELWSGKITTGVYSYPASKDSDEVD